jgi:hypothetical protein
MHAAFFFSSLHRENDSVRVPACRNNPRSSTTLELDARQNEWIFSCR